MCEYVCEPYGLTVDGHNNGPYSRRERIVRCRDCVHYREPDRRHGAECTGIMAFVVPTPDSFCSWARPMEVE